MLAVSVMVCILSFTYGKLQIDIQKNIRSDGMTASVYIENGTEDMAQQLNSLSYISETGKQKFAGKLLQQKLKGTGLLLERHLSYKRDRPAKFQVIRVFYGIPESGGSFLHCIFIGKETGEKQSYMEPLQGID